MAIRTMLLILVTACAGWAADVTGSWQFLLVGKSGDEIKGELVIENQGGTLGGTIGNEQGSLPLEDVKLDGNNLTYKISYQGGYSFKLTCEGNTMKGTYSTADGVTGKMTATKK